MADATSLTPPSPGLSATLRPNKSVEPNSPKGPENVKLTTLYRYTGRLLGRRIPDSEVKKKQQINEVT